MSYRDEAPSSDAGTRSPVVLVVDDEPIVRMALSDHLKDCGYQSVEASNADDAIAILTTGAEIDVVFTDVQMPGEIDGFGLAKWVREHRPELSVFVASGYSGKLDLARDLCSGEQYFTKPYDFDVVTAKIQEALDARSKPKH